MRRPSSEVSILRATVLLRAEAPLGAFVAMGGAELTLCRRADAIAALVEVGRTGAAALRARLTPLAGLRAAVRPDRYYLSKLAVAPGRRGHGVGQALLERYLDVGRAAGYERFRLDVSAENEAAVELYRSAGFRPVSESVSGDPQLRLIAMEWKEDAC